MLGKPSRCLLESATFLWFYSLDGLAGAVSTQLRGILALDGGDARGELTGIGHPHVIADDVRALVQAVDEDVGLCVLGLLIEPGVVLAAVT